MSWWGCDNEELKIKMTTAVQVMTVGAFIFAKGRENSEGRESGGGQSDRVAKSSEI